MATTHISLAEAGDEMAGLVRRVQGGEEIHIHGEHGGEYRLVEAMPQGRTVEETIARLTAFEKDRGVSLTMDEDFAADMREILAMRRPARWSDSE